MKTQNRVHRKGGKGRLVSQAKSKRTTARNGRVVIQMQNASTGEPFADVEFSAEQFAALQRAVKKSGLSLPEFFNTAIREKLPQVEAARAAHSEPAASAGNGAGELPSEITITEPLTFNRELFERCRAHKQATNHGQVNTMLEEALRLWAIEEGVHPGAVKDGEWKFKLRDKGSAKAVRPSAAPAVAPGEAALSLNALRDLQDRMEASNREVRAFHHCLIMVMDDKDNQPNKELVCGLQTIGFRLQEELDLIFDGLVKQARAVSAALEGRAS